MFISRCEQIILAFLILLRLSEQTQIFEALGILVCGFGSRKKGKVPVMSICDPFRVLG